MRSFRLLLISLTATKQLKQLPHYTFKVFADFITMPRLQKGIAIDSLILPNSLLLSCSAALKLVFILIYQFLCAHVTNTRCQRALHMKRLIIRIYGAFSRLSTRLLLSTLKKPPSRGDFCSIKTPEKRTV